MLTCPRRRFEQPLVRATKTVLFISASAPTGLFKGILCVFRGEMVAVSL
jgi:hypothetical protein